MSAGVLARGARENTRVRRAIQSTSRGGSRSTGVAAATLATTQLATALRPATALCPRQFPSSSNTFTPLVSSALRVIEMLRTSAAATAASGVQVRSTPPHRAASGARLASECSDRAVTTLDAVAPTYASIRRERGSLLLAFRLA